MKKIKIKAIGTLAVWTTFIMDYLDSITATEFIRKAVKVTAFGTLTLAAVMAFYMGLVVICCVL